MPDATHDLIPEAERDMIAALLRAEEERGYPEVRAESLPLAQSWLRTILTDADCLKAHVDLLARSLPTRSSVRRSVAPSPFERATQSPTPTSSRRLFLLDEAQTEEVAENGPGSLSPSELGKLLLSPFALDALAEHIHESPPGWWLEHLVAAGEALTRRHRLNIVLPPRVARSDEKPRRQSNSVWPGEEPTTMRSRMDPDSENRYRPTLKEKPPLFFDRVNTPWDQVPDLEEYNEAAYRSIIGALRSVKQKQARGSNGTEGLLILGEAGTGKTHLLMRVARTLSATNHILFVRRPKSEDAVARHIWFEMVTSLTKPVPTANGSRSQLDDLLARVFSAVLIPEFEQDIREDKDAVRKQKWVSSLHADPFNLFDMLGKGAQRQKNLDTIRRRTLRYLQVKHPDVDQQIAHGLITYCFYSRDNDKRVLLTWLAGEEQDPADTERLGLPDAWGHASALAESSDVAKRREDKALQAIRTIGILSTYYEPLILAFDQLEGLRGNRELTLAWGDTVREIFTQTPNLLILTCIFPSLWKEWFSAVSDTSVTDRIAPGKPILLEQFSPSHARKLLAKHLEEAAAEHQLPSDIYPFGEADILELCEGANSPRKFIQAASNRFKEWLDGRMEPPPKAPIPTEAEIDRLLRDTLRGYEKEAEERYPEQLLVEHEFFGRVRVILESILAESPQRLSYTQARCGNKVMPPNIVVQGGAASVCIAVSNAEGNSFTACARNLLTVLQERKQMRGAVLLRDRRSRTITGKVAQEHLADLQSAGGEYLIVGKDEFALLSAIFETLVAAEEHDLAIGNHSLGKADVVRFLCAERVGRRSLVLAAVARQFPALATQLGLDTPGAGAPGRAD